MSRVSKSQKKQLNQGLKKLKELLSGSKSQEAVDHLMNELESVEVTKEEKGKGDFNLPASLTDNYEWFAFSDGACRGNPGPGAWGALVQGRDSQVVYEGSGVDVPTTNNKMELQGAIEALNFLKNEDSIPSDSKMILFSDSKYVVDGITSWVSGWKKRGWKKADKKVPENVELWQELDALNEGFSNLQFKWVKGHSGHPQNEHCDQLANNALDEAGF